MKNAIIAILVVFLSSCNSQKQRKADYEVSKKEIFEISLKSNSTTGYSWKWIKKETVASVDSISVNYIQDNADQAMIGIGGTEIWKFRGKRSGTDTLIFGYCRPWDAASTVETKKIIVKIK